nr:MAG TPA: hypothetical protein [Caudoviricetes sp.]
MTPEMVRLSQILYHTNAIFIANISQPSLGLTTSYCLNES